MDAAQVFNILVNFMLKIRMNMTRTEKSRRKLFGGYHLTTGIFAGLSLVSYFIPPDIVPGRMGMLITLYLSLINSYNSVDAPPDRGFSSIEIWFYGMQALILLALLEYGLILSLKMFLKWKWSSYQFKTMDFTTLLVASITLSSFNIYYWLL